MMRKQVIITKASGKKEAFSENKLRNSLFKSGADEVTVNQIIGKVKDNLYDDITTHEIYKRAFEILKSKKTATASRYKLKKSIMELGPDGFAFEIFISEILKKLNYKTEVGKIIKGFCVNHEIDVIAQDGIHHYMVECKFHNQQGKFCDVKIPLYINSRFIDVERTWTKQIGHEELLHKGWLFTNTRFTTDAIQYGSCAGLKMTSWDYPENGNLKDLTDQFRLYPVTVLSGLSKTEKEELLRNKIILCTDLPERKDFFERMSISAVRQKKLIDECFNLLN